MHKILIADKMDAVALRVFQERGLEVDEKINLNPDDLARIIGDYDGVAVRSTTKITAQVLKSPGRLRVIGRAGMGVDTIDVAAATDAGIVVMNTPHGNSVTTAEHTVAMMMSLARQIPQAHASTHAGKWEKSAFQGVELMGKTLGVIGCGNIGALVAARAIGLQMHVIAYDPFLTPARADDLGVTSVTLSDLYARSDFITLHTPLNDETRHMINTATLATMKRGVRIINVARGGLVVEQDLLNALNSGQVAGAALDVFAVEPATSNILFGHPRVICTPHLGASTVEAQINVAEQIATQISDYLLNGIITHAVNLPSVSADDAPRLTPWLRLAGHLGRLLAQQIGTGPDRFTLTLAGPASTLNSKALIAAAVAGFIGFRRDGVNPVNALAVAKAQGLAVQTVTQDDPDQMTPRLIIEVGGAHVAGTVYPDGSSRIIDMDGVTLDAVLSPHMILIRNTDQPGMIGALGTLLAAHAINIADFRLGRVTAGGQAVALVAVDTAPGAALMDQIRAIPQIRQAIPLSF